MLTFVTSLRHPDTARDYGQVEALLGTTLRSLGAQTDRRCRVVVTANRPFAVPGDVDVPVEVVEVDFPVPPHAADQGVDHQNGVRLDKGAKLGVGLSRVPDGHVMFLDADDFVNGTLTAFVHAHAAELGWYVENGLRYDVGTGLYQRQRNFNSVCGTSLLIRRDALPMPTLPARPTRDEVVEAFGEDCVLHLLGSHHFLRERFSLPSLPMVGAAYSVNTGHNDSRRPALALARPLTARLAAEFGIPRHQPRLMWQSTARIAPRGIAQAARRTAGAAADKLVIRRAAQR